MGKALTPSQAIALAMDLIKGTIYEQRLLLYKRERGLNTEILLDIPWYNGFMDRYSEYLQSGGCLIKNIKRASWCLFENFKNMYVAVYNAMVAAKVRLNVQQRWRNY
jgi:hypothetical protein